MNNFVFPSQIITIHQQQATRHHVPTQVTAPFTSHQSGNTSTAPQLSTAIPLEANPGHGTIPEQFQ
jgi:hypothetical protein